MFNYNEAFSRNLGWVTETEQEILRSKRIAIAGLGGVGGSHLLTLSRLGIGAFSIADFDVFELANFNRQAGAGIRQLGRSKLEVMAEMALDINPELDLRKLDQGVKPTNVDEFLEGVDLYVDALDFFALDARNTVFAACQAKGIPALTAAPLGMGAALLVFMPGRMSFERYFRMQGHSEDEQALRFMLGLAPARLQLPYLVDENRVDFRAKKGPSTGMACELCAGFAGTYALKILLNRGSIPVAPRGIHFDAFRNKLTTTWRPGGNDNPIQRLGLLVARKIVMDKQVDTTLPTPFTRPVERILDLARWAPSGDNEQPWRFQILDDNHLRIECHDTRTWCVYDLDGTSSHIAVGALLETIAIAATGEKLLAEFNRGDPTPDNSFAIDVRLREAQGISADPLLPYIRARVTQRKPFATGALTKAKKQRLEMAVGGSYRVIWLEGRSARLRMAKLLFHNAHIRLTTQEAYEVHRQNIEWGVRFSETKIPEHALGIDLLTRKVMRWALRSWKRVKILNRFFAGTWLPRLQMDFLTGWRCGAHFAIIADQPLETIDDYIAGGRAMQRFWLEATRLGLQFQPEMTPVIFSRYVARDLAFTQNTAANRLAVDLAQKLDRLLGPEQDAARRVFMGRLGFAATPTSRSVRQPLVQLLSDQHS